MKRKKEGKEEKRKDAQKKSMRDFCSHINKIKIKREEKKMSRSKTITKQFFLFYILEEDGHFE